MLSHKFKNRYQRKKERGKPLPQELESLLGSIEDKYHELGQGKKERETIWTVNEYGRDHKRTQIK